jgi:hypothetical protein
MKQLKPNDISYSSVLPNNICGEKKVAHQRILQMQIASTSNYGWRGGLLRGIISTALVSGMFICNPIVALAVEQSTPSSAPSSATIYLPIAFTPILSAAPLMTKPIPSAPLPSTPLSSSPLPSSPIPRSLLLSTPLPSSPSSSLVSNSLLKSPKAQDSIFMENNQEKGKGQVLVNLPGNVRESIAAGAANIPGKSYDNCNHFP